MYIICKIKNNIEKRCVTVSILKKESPKSGTLNKELLQRIDNMDSEEDFNPYKAIKRTNISTKEMFNDLDYKVSDTDSDTDDGNEKTNEIIVIVILGAILCVVVALLISVLI